MEQQTAFTETIGTTTYTVTVSSAEDAKEKPEQQFLNLILDDLSFYLNEYSGVKSITCPAIGNHHSGQTEISIPEMEITNILS